MSLGAQLSQHCIASLRRHHLRVVLQSKARLLPMIGDTAPNTAPCIDDHTPIRISTRPCTVATEAETAFFLYFRESNVRPHVGSGIMAVCPRR